MRYTRGEFATFAHCYDGVDEAAEVLGVDEDVLQSAINGQKLPRNLEKDLERRFEDFRDENPDTDAVITRVDAVLEMYPELFEIIDNDGVGKALVENEAFTDIFYKDPTFYTDPKTGERKSGGGLYPGAVVVIVEWAKKTKKGTPRKRGQADLTPMIKALEACDYDLSDESNAFWAWFRSIYPH